MHQFNEQNFNQLNYNNLEPNNLSNDLSYSNPYYSGLVDNVPLLNPSYNIPSYGFPDLSNNLINPILENGYLCNGSTIYNPHLLNSNYFNQPMNQNLENLKVHSFQEPYLGNTYDISLPNSYIFSLLSVQNNPNIIRLVPVPSENFNEYKDQSDCLGSDFQKGKILETENFSNEGGLKSSSNDSGNVNDLKSPASGVGNADGFEEKGKHISQIC